MTDEPPYFLPHDSFNTSNDISESERQHIGTGHVHAHNPFSGIGHSATNGSIAGEFRSVIDDLTVQNKKLRERLRKYETSHSSHLDKDKLFEIKIHGLPARKRRELEDTLRAFASSLDLSTDQNSSRLPMGKLLAQTSLDSGIGSVPKHTSSSSTSNSRPNDSAYASMSNSGPTSTSTLNHVTLEGTGNSQSRIGKDQKIQSFLHNIPEGLLPKHSPVMTERQKKKIVVRRLEQLFTGKIGVVGEHSQPMQQQEVSKSAAKAERAAGDRSAPIEGTREAQMLTADMELDGAMPGNLPEESNNDTEASRGLSGSTDDTSDSGSLEQRPTRPLDLDPDRTQIPSDNVDYIRHLGLSTPKLITENSGDVESDAEGWIYLNLLTNMAQLHIINVTPDFVRSAVADVSDKFQLSRDGKKIRWRGGTEGTRLSSESGASSAQNRSPLDSDSLEEASRKRRKVDIGRFASVPTDLRDPAASARDAGPSDSFHYEPLFRHRGSSSGGLMSSDDSDCSSGNDSSRVSRPRIRTGTSRSRSRGRRRQDDGPIVFYSGAQFFTDLSGDRGYATTPPHVTTVDKDGYSSHTRDALGCRQRQNAPPFLRTPSGSYLPFRPFKDYSKGPDSMQIEGNRARTPELLTGDPRDSELSTGWSEREMGQPTSLQMFNASGIGGTQPADHFAVTVETRRTKLPVHRVVKPRKFLAQSPGSKRFSHVISNSSLDSFRGPELDDTAEIITSPLAELAAFSSPPHQKTVSRRELPVKTEFISAHFTRLQPSELPEPSAYYNALSSSDDESDCSGSSFSGISHLRQDKSYLQRSFTSPSDPDAPRPQEFETKTYNLADGEDDEDEEEDESEESDNSIDMLALVREIDPETVAAREQEFDMEVYEPPMRSSAATVDGESRYSGVVSLGNTSSSEESSSD